MNNKTIQVEKRYAITFKFLPFRYLDTSMLKTQWEEESNPLIPDIKRKEEMFIGWATDKYPTREELSEKLLELSKTFDISAWLEHQRIHPHKELIRIEIERLNDLELYFQLEREAKNERYKKNPELYKFDELINTIIPR